jgi:hypothetical protein
MNQLKYKTCFYNVEELTNKIPDDCIRIVISYLTDKEYFEKLVTHIPSNKYWHITKHWYKSRKDETLHIKIENDLRKYNCTHTMCSSAKHDNTISCGMFSPSVIVSGNMSENISKYYDALWIFNEKFELIKFSLDVGFLKLINDENDEEYGFRIYSYMINERKYVIENDNKPFKLIWSFHLDKICLLSDVDVNCTIDSTDYSAIDDSDDEEQLSISETTVPKNQEIVVPWSLSLL